MPARVELNAEEAAFERFDAGYIAHKRGAARPAETDAAAGWDMRDGECRTHVIMPARPEGYYHQNPNGEA
jgi:hypothetical protein